MKKRSMKKKSMKAIHITLAVLLGLAMYVMISPMEAHAATTITLEPGQTYDFSEKSNYKKYGAFYVDIRKGGHYHLKGSASNTMVRIDPPEGEEAVVWLDGVKLTPNNTAPGSLPNYRAAITIGNGGGTVTLRANHNVDWGDGLYGNVFMGQGDMPAIRKDKTKTKLVFLASTDADRIIAKADPEGFRTSAIGCYVADEAWLSRLTTETTGNIYFERGYVEAWGSHKFTNGWYFDRWDGGVGIGAGGFGSVDGIYINGGEILAVAGDTGAAGIGTPSAFVTGAISKYPLLCSEANNIQINGGKVRVEHFAEVGSKGATKSGTGASIGGGCRSDVHNLVINGGDISNTTSQYRPCTGIGAGEEADAWIKITGGKIDVKARQVGIGAYAEEETDASVPDPPDPPKSDTDSGTDSDTPAPVGDGSNTAWYGDVHLDITGGDIRVDSDKTCLGGGKPGSKDGYVEIDGGTFDLYSGAKLTGPVIGPACYVGKLRRITIRGGRINAHRELMENNTKEHVAMIGNAHHPDKQMHRYNNSIVEYIEITGGTVRLKEGSDQIGTIGGNKGKENNRDYSTVIINGGNVRAKILDSDSNTPVDKLNSDDAVPVYCQKIDMQIGTQYVDRDEPNPVQAAQLLLNNGDEIDYGLNDCFMFEEDPELWFWLPGEAQWGKVETRFDPFRGLNANVFSGMLKNSLSGQDGQDSPENGSTYKFYPPVYLKLNAGESNEGDGTVLYGDTKCTTFNGVDDSGFPKLITTYNSEPAGGIPVLDRFGTFQKEDDHEYIDQNGRWVFLGRNGDVDRSIFDRSNGTTLYAVLGKYDLDLHFDENIPAKTQSTLSGTMPPDLEYENNDRVTLPADQGDGYGFSLRGYSFTGWNTKADGTGRSYASGQGNIPATDFRASVSDPGDVTLYAQWTPITYAVRYGSTDPQLDDITIEYTYDEAAKFAWGDELQAWGKQREFLAGWTYDDQKFIKDSKLLNFVDFDEDGSVKPRTLDAVWMQPGEIRVKVMVDGKGVSGLADDIVINESNGGKPQTRFEEDEDEAGLYRNVCETPVPDDTYTVSIGDRRLDPDEAEFSYDRKDASYIELHAYTVTLNKPMRVESVSLDPCDDYKDGKPYIIAPIGYKAEIDAQAGGGYVAYGWAGDGTEPEWDPSKVKQTITIKGTAELTPQIRAAQYTVEFDPNNGANPRSEDATGTMEPQVFQVGKDQQLTASAFSKKGYRQYVYNEEVQAGGVWSRAQSGEGAIFDDQQTISGDQPLSMQDGAEVTLYAIWEPLPYTIRYLDENGYAQQFDFTQGAVYDDFVELPSVEPIIGANNLELYGWRKYHDPDARIYRPGERVTNLCSVDGDTVTGYTMEPVWVEKADLALMLTLDGAPLTGKASDIKLTNGTRVFDVVFSEDQRLPGRYIYQFIDSPDPIPPGTYRLVMDGYEVPQNETFEYIEGTKQSLEYDFFTISMKTDDNAASAKVGTESIAPAESIVALKDAQVTISAEADAGYHFDGWSWIEDQKPSDLDPSKAEQSVTVSGTTELTAHAAGNVYTVQFDPNDGLYPGTEAASGSMEDQDMVFGEPQKLFLNKYNKVGYTLFGWNTKPDGSGDSYADRQSVQDLTTVENGTVTLYAIWEPRTYKITYIDPYRLCRTETQTVEYDETVPLLDAEAPGWKPLGHTLSGWTGEALGSFYESGQQVTNFCTVNENGTLTGNVLYAEWSDLGNIRVVITLDNMGVDADPDDIELISHTDGTTYSGCFLKESDVPGRYMFDPSGLLPEGSDGQGGDGQGGDGQGGPDVADLIPEGEYTVHLNNYESYGLADISRDIEYSADKAAQAVLASDTVTMKAGAHVSSVSVSDPKSGRSGESVVVAHGKEADISAVVDEKGYHFGSYVISGTMPDMDPAITDQRIQVYGPVTLTAQAAPNTYFIHYDANGGSGKKDDQKASYDKKTKLTANTFTRPHYTFAGWNSKANGSGTAYRDKSEVLNLTSEDGAVVTLYAQWRMIPKYTVTFVTNGGSKVPPQTVEKGSVAKKPKNPKRPGYAFTGWYANKGLTKPYSFGTKITANTTVYAKWTKKNDKVPVLIAQGKPSGKRAIKTSWNKVDGAAKYIIYGAKCGEKPKRIKTTAKNSFKVKKIKGKKLIRHRAYIFYVKALDKNGRVIATSKDFHVITAKIMGNCANIRSIKADKKQITLRKGRSVRVGATVRLPEGKVHLSRIHGPQLKFTSDNPKTASVSRTGMVKAKAPGKATIYIQDTSGKFCTTVVTVK